MRMRFPAPSKYTQKTASLELAQDLSLIQITGTRKRICLWIQGSPLQKAALLPPWSCSHRQSMVIVYNVRSLGSRETRGKLTAKGWSRLSKSTRLPGGGQGKAWFQASLFQAPRLLSGCMFSSPRMPVRLTAPCTYHSKWVSENKDILNTSTI